MNIQYATVFLFLSLAFSLAHSDSIKIGYFDHKPHQYLDTQTGEVRGAAVRYFERVAFEMGYEVEWVGPLPNKRMFFFVKQGKMLDGIAHLYPQKELEELLYYAKKPHYLAKPIVVVRSASGLRAIRSAEDLDGSTVLWIKDTMPSPYIANHKSLLRMKYINPAEKLLWQRSLQMLLHGRVDAVHELNEFTIPYAAKTMNVDKEIKVIPLPEPPVAFYSTFSRKSPLGKVLLEKYNEAHEKLGMGDVDYRKFLQSEMGTL